MLSVPVDLLVDAVIVFTAVEVVALLVYHASTGHGVAPRECLANLLSGLALMLALGAQVHGAATAWVALCLLVAGLAHGVDLVRRWQGAPARGAAHRKVSA